MRGYINLDLVIPEIGNKYFKPLYSQNWSAHLGNMVHGASSKKNKFNSDRDGHLQHYCKTQTVETTQFNHRKRLSK